MFAIDLGDGSRLRLWDDRDAVELYELIELNRETLSPWMPWAADQTLERTREFIAGSRRQWAEGHGVETAIVLDETIVGGAGINRVDPANRSANVGYWLAAEFQGRGIVTRAVAALLDEAFDVLGLHRIELRAGPENAPSRAVAQRLGFVEEGVLREAEWVGPHYLDHVMHSMLADDWAARRASGP